MLSEGGSHGPFRDVRKARVNLGPGQVLRIGHPQRMMPGDRRLQAVHQTRPIGDEEVACVAHRDLIVRDADDLGEVLVDADALLGQVGHRRLGELQPERLDGLGGSQGAQIARISSSTVSSPARESQKAVATPTMPPPITTASAVAGQV